MFFLPLPALLRGISKADSLSFIIGAGPPVLVLLSFLFLLLALPRLRKAASYKGTLLLPTFMEQGVSRSIEFNLPLPKFIPGIRLAYRWFLKFGVRRQNILIPLGPSGISKGEIQFPYRGIWTGRGYLRATDLFGFFLLDCAVSGNQTVVVPPKEFEGPQDGFPGRPNASSSTALRLKDDAEEKLERREYVPGDDPRHIDWKLYARTGGLIVRTGEDGVPRRGRVWICGPGYGRLNNSGDQNRFDRVAELFGALVRRLEDEGREVFAWLPGESRWKSVDSPSDWKNRLAQTLPNTVEDINMPEPGERLFVLGNVCSAGAAGNSSLLNLVRRARSASCLVTLLIPESQKEETYSLLFRQAKETINSTELFHTFFPWRKKQESRAIRQLVKIAADEGIDVRAV